MAQIDLHAELWQAMETARKLPGTEPAPFGGIQWGMGYVEYYGVDRALYEPQADRRAAFIVPLIEDGDTLDLVAVEAYSQHVGGRHGLGYALGMDAIEKARWGGCHLHLVERPLDWLRQQPWALAEARRFIIATDRSLRGEKAPDIDLTPPDDFTYLFDLHQVVRILEDIEQFSVHGFAFGERVRALFPPSQRERVLIVT